MDPISILAILGGTTMLYNGASCAYNYYYAPPVEIVQEKRNDNINITDVIEIPKEIIEFVDDDEILPIDFINVQNNIINITEKYEIDYSDVIRELQHLFEIQEKNNNKRFNLIPINDPISIKINHIIDDDMNVVTDIDEISKVLGIIPNDENEIIMKC